MPAINFPAIKSAYDLEQTVSSYLGEPQAKKWLCPFHKESSPSFTIWAEGERFKCFGCGAEGDILDFIRLYENLGNARQAALKLTGGGADGYLLDLGLTPVELRAKKAEIEAERAKVRAEREAAKLARDTEAISRAGSMQGKVEYYHSQVGQALDYWHSQGIYTPLIEKYRLGFAPLCPLLYPSEERQGSYVIPSYQAGRLVSIRHRLSRPNGHGKYRPEFAGLPPCLFNVDSLGEDSFLLSAGEILVVEGEVKSVVVNSRIEAPCVGLPGATNWRAEWGEHLKRHKIHTAYWIPDPGLEQKTIDFVAGGLKAAGCKVVIISMPIKPDDALVLFNISTNRFIKYLEKGRLYRE